MIWAKIMLPDGLICWVEVGADGEHQVLVFSASLKGMRATKQTVLAFYIEMNKTLEETLCPSDEADGVAEHNDAVAMHCLGLRQCGS